MYSATCETGNKGGKIYACEYTQYKVITSSCTREHSQTHSIVWLSFAAHSLKTISSKYPFKKLRCVLVILQVMLEMFRHSPVVPMLPPHSATQDGHLGGYFIPKNTQARK